jgi:ABC-2 type transport system ATP-binding protein
MPVRKYSKGMLQRLGLAQAMLHDPELLILDEPTDGVDPVGRREMRTVLQELKTEGKTIFINSHLLQEVELVCDHVAILVEGTLRREGSIHDITTRMQPDVLFTVRADEATLRESMARTSNASWQRQGQDLMSITLASPKQEQINRCLDDLRGRQIDIISVIPRRDSLEDVFLAVVAQPGEDGLVRSLPVSETK